MPQEPHILGVCEIKEENDIGENAKEQVDAFLGKARDADALAGLVLEMDPTYRLIPAVRRTELASMALETGRAWAHELRATHPAEDLALLAQQLGVEVEFSDEANEAGDVVIRSEYYDAPARIVIYQSSLEKTREVIEQAGLAAAIDPGLLLPIHLAHELFHHLEHLKQDRLSQRYKVPTLRIGQWNLIVSGVRALSEIGAHAFVQAWLRLDWFPFAIDQLERLTRGDTRDPVDRWNEFSKKRSWFGGWK